MAMRRLLGLSAALLALAAPGVSLAAEGGNTVKSAVERRVEGGELRGCGVTFTVISADPFHGKGQLMVIGGRLEVFLTDSRELGVLLMPGLGFTGAPEAIQSPALAYLVADSKANDAEVFKVMPGAPGRMIFTYRLGPVTTRAVDDLARTGTFIFGFSMKDPPDSLNAAVVDIRVKDSGVMGGKAQSDAEAPARFGACVNEIRALAKPA